MKTLKDYVLIFDGECPLCRTYSSAFVKTGMLDVHGRESYQEMDTRVCYLVDKDKARNEIALVNKHTGDTLYGIDSLFRILENSFPFFTRLFHLAAFRWLMKKLYFFISYNRKVIIPSQLNKDSCVPDLNYKYRWAYLITTWLITSLVLASYSSRFGDLLPQGKFLREFFICGGQILFQASFVSLIAKDKLINYLGNMMTISLAGALILLVLMGAGNLFAIVSPEFYAAAFLATAGLMFLEHIRRMKLLEIHWSASVSWVVYRISLLFFIL
jgi:predicted DCC family thiol-disulfide oxidoreductase YuxK